MKYYLYKTQDSTLIDMVDAVICGKDCLSCSDGSVLVLPQGIEVSSKEDLSEKLLEEQAIRNPDQAARLDQIEELMMEMIYGGAHE